MTWRNQAGIRKVGVFCHLLFRICHCTPRIQVVVLLGGKKRREMRIKVMTKWARTKLDLETVLFCKWVSTQTVHNSYLLSLTQ